MIAIGGGGGSSESNQGGGGSGYVKTVVIDISSTDYQVSVGQYGHESFVKKNDGQKVITAQPGGNARWAYARNYGGDGYSGGGGGYRGTTGGGYNGSDGDCCYEGSGSGFDISTISLEHNILSPGLGGSPGNYGGGGGGVLVNNVGPNFNTNFSNTYMGRGYGGGGSRSGYSGHGLQGMVFIEVNPRTKNIIP